MQYSADFDAAIKSITAVIARLGYTLKSVDNHNGLIAFETGISMSSFAGQNMSVHVLQVAGSVQVTVGGTMKSHGAQLQLVDWGESRGIATKIFGQLNNVLGPGHLVSGSLQSGMSAGAICFIVAVVFAIIVVFISQA